MRLVRQSLIAVGGALAVAAAVAPAAEAFVYWANQNTGIVGSIGRAELDGTRANQHFIDGVPGPAGVAVNGSHIYWANLGGASVGRANLDGSGATSNFIAGADGPIGVALNASHVFWANTQSSSIGRANLDGTAATQSFITGVTVPCGVAVDGANVYWANGGSIGRANLDGTAVNPGFIAGGIRICGVAVNATHIYWADTDSGSIGRANLDGSGANPNFIRGTPGPCGVATDGSHVYWGHTESDSIARANLDGTGANQVFIGGARNPCGVAIDGRTAAAPPPVVGRSVNVAVVRGVVTVRRPGSRVFRRLSDEAQVPVGSEVDTRRGRVRLTSAADAAGATRTGEFYDGRFVVRQARARRPVTELVLSEPLICPRAANARAAVRRRRLWGSGRGRFRTRGRYAAAVVRGTVWLTQDACTSTTVRVTEGTVAVRDFARRRTVTVRAGRSYTARSRR